MLNFGASKSEVKWGLGPQGPLDLLAYLTVINTIEVEIISVWSMLMIYWSCESFFWYLTYLWL